MLLSYSLKVLVLQIAPHLSFSGWRSHSCARIVHKPYRAVSARAPPSAGQAPLTISARPPNTSVVGSIQGRFAVSTSSVCGWCKGSKWNHNNLGDQVRRQSRPKKRDVIPSSGRKWANPGCASKLSLYFIYSQMAGHTRTPWVAHFRPGEGIHISIPPSKRACELSKSSTAIVSITVPELQPHSQIVGNPEAKGVKAPRTLQFFVFTSHESFSFIDYSSIEAPSKAPKRGSHLFRSLHSSTPPPTPKQPY